MSIIFRLLLKNLSPGRIIGFAVSNFIGLAIIVGGIIFYNDASALWKSEDSFISSDYLVINKKVTAGNLWGERDNSFTESDIEDLSVQPWVRKIGTFTSNDYKVWASIGDNGGRNISTMLFFESVPDEFVDGASAYDWSFSPDDGVVPIIMSKDYLTLYNFGFAGSQGLPQLSENLVGSVPLHFTLRSEDGGKSKELVGRIVGFSNKLNTILVPQQFMEWSNSNLGRRKYSVPSRLIVDVSSPGDVAIKEYLEEKGFEVAGDKTSSSAAFLLRVITGIVISVGGVITVMSLFILILSISLLMEKSKEKIHALLMLGYPLGRVMRPYLIIVVVSSLIAYGGSVIFGLLLRGSYLPSLIGLGSIPESPWVGLLTGALITLGIILFNIFIIRKRVITSWR